MLHLNYSQLRSENSIIDYCSLSLKLEKKLSRQSSQMSCHGPNIPTPHLQTYPNLEPPTQKKPYHISINNHLLPFNRTLLLLHLLFALLLLPNIIINAIEPVDRRQSFDEFVIIGLFRFAEIHSIICVEDPFATLHLIAASF